MEGGRSSVALLLLALALAAGSLSAVAQFHPPADTRYMLVTVDSGGGNQARLAVRTSGGVSIPGFANATHHWFAVTGSESLVPRGNGYGGGDIPAGQGLMGDLLRVLVNNGTQ